MVTQGCGWNPITKQQRINWLQLSLIHHNAEHRVPNAHLYLSAVHLLGLLGDCCFTSLVTFCSLNLTLGTNHLLIFHRCFQIYFPVCGLSLQLYLCWCFSFVWWAFFCLYVFSLLFLEVLFGTFFTDTPMLYTFSLCFLWCHLIFNHI